MIITPPEWLAAAAAPWSTLYADSGFVRTIVVGLHLLPLLLGGGIAVALDRATLRIRLSDSTGDRTRQLREISAAHRWVGAALAIILVSGVLLLLADLEQYLASPTFWIKLTLVSALAINGIAMTRVERTLAAQAEGEPWDESADASWRRLERRARTSLMLWILIVTAGVALVNAG